MKGQKMSEIKDKVLYWLANGEVGISSKAMAMEIIGTPYRGPFYQFGTTPSDPADFRRCLLLFKHAPELRENLDRCRDMSPLWDKLVGEWDALEKLLISEVGEDLDRGSAPLTYARMKELGL